MKFTQTVLILVIMSGCTASKIHLKKINKTAGIFEVTLPEGITAPKDDWTKITTHRGYQPCKIKNTSNKTVFIEQVHLGVKGDYSFARLQAYLAPQAASIFQDCIYIYPRITFKEDLEIDLKIVYRDASETRVQSVPFNGSAAGRAAVLEMDGVQ